MAGLVYKTKHHNMFSTNTSISIVGHTVGLIIDT